MIKYEVYFTDVCEVSVPALLFHCLIFVDKIR